MCMQRGIDKPLDDGIVCCTKGCHDRVVKQREKKGGGYKLNWPNNGKNGLEDPYTSMHILLDWLLVEGNYLKWRGKNNNGEKKCGV